MTKRMNNGRPESEYKDKFPHDFVTTDWQMVADAGGPAFEATTKMTAFGTLYQLYWGPLVRFAQYRFKRNAQDAEDDTGEFFLWLQRGNQLEKAKEPKGRFRSFLLTCYKHYLINMWTKERHRFLPSLAAEVGSTDDTDCSAHGGEPDIECDMNLACAQELLKRSFERLKTDQERAGHQRRYELLLPHLEGRKDALPYAELAEGLCDTEGNLRVYVHRLKEGLKKIMREEVSRTVENPLDQRIVKEELAFVIRCLQSRS